MRPTLLNLAALLAYFLGLGAGFAGFFLPFFGYMPFGITRLL